MEVEPVAGKPLRFPPGRVEIRLNDEHRRAYRRLYAESGTTLGDLPVLRPDRDFDGRAVRVTASELGALNRAFASLRPPRQPGDTVFDVQEDGRTALFKRLQYLS